MLLISCLLSAMAAPLSFDRIDVLSEDPGTWFNYEIPTLHAYPTKGLVRWVAQIKPVWKTSIDGLYLGTSFTSQSLTFESPIKNQLPVYWTATYQTQLLLPKGVNIGLAWRGKGLRLAVGCSAIAESSWARPAYRSWFYDNLSHQSS